MNAPTLPYAGPPLAGAGSGSPLAKYSPCQQHTQCRTQHPQPCPSRCAWGSRWVALDLLGPRRHRHSFVRTFPFGSQKNYRPFPAPFAGPRALGGPAGLGKYSRPFPAPFPPPLSITSGRISISRSCSFVTRTSSTRSPTFRRKTIEAFPLLAASSRIIKRFSS